MSSDGYAGPTPEQWSQIKRMIDIARNLALADCWVPELEKLDTNVIVMVIAKLNQVGASSGLREAATAVIQDRAIRQQQEMTVELRRLIATTERLEQGATKLQRTAIIVGAVVSLVGIAVGDVPFVVDLG